ncbi:MAG TPA: M24 family metallopeptidase [Thermomicrobiales bacterium]|nr:aminopeptidase P family protein [Chloroflexota bacterium]HQZ90336.1 M24 family metallopeptidase [Thermomicrobiales bacterium]HRA30752.1 M24 family metallopeptidase [Thermomicrobiales bacterium]
MTDNSIVREKLAQAVEVLEEEGVDLWMIVARESDVLGDPSMPLVVGTSVTWESAFLISRTGDHRAIVAVGDVENIRQTGAWDNVVGYVEGISGELIRAFDELQPNMIALNYSIDNYMSDGVTHGMYLLLEEMLRDTPHWAKVQSSGEIPTKVRARKSPAELERIRTAVRTTERIWEALEAWLRPGLTERQISEYMHGQLDERRIGSSWDWNYCPGVTAGPDSPRGHVGPTDVETRAGQLLSIDFGVREDEYCSDLQRTFYFLKPGETEAPDDVKRYFAIVDRCIQDAAAFVRPGVMGWEVDDVARRIFAEAGLEEWQYALGHQMGRACHDGGTVLGPRWERYGQRPYGKLEVDEVYTLEIGCLVPGYGVVSQEEDIIVTADGCEFLAAPQRKVILIPS